MHVNLQKVRKLLTVLLLGSLFACAGQELQEPLEPNITLRDDMSLSETLIWANSHYELSIYENLRREQSFIDERDTWLVKLEEVNHLKLIEEERALRLEDTFEKNALLIQEKQLKLKKMLVSLQSNRSCWVEAKRLACKTVSGRVKYLDLNDYSQLFRVRQVNL